MACQGSMIALVQWGLGGGWALKRPRVGGGVGSRVTPPGSAGSGMLTPIVRSC